MKSKNRLLLVTLAMISLVIITGKISYSFFTYMKEGTTENVIKTGIITFFYTEVEENGKGITIQEAFPIDDETGKVQVGTNRVFDFMIQSTNTSKSSIPYEITARKKSDSTLDEKAVKIYLTEITTEDYEDEKILDVYSNLNQTSVEVSEDVVEKRIYTDIVPASTKNYEKKFRLRMWISDDIDFSSTKDENNIDVYPYNDKTFTVTINVYANTEIVTVPMEPIS